MPRAALRARTLLPIGNVRLTRRLRLKKSLPSPALRAMNAPLTIGRPAVPCTVVSPDVMLNGSAEYDCSMLLTWKP